MKTYMTSLQAPNDFKSLINPKMSKNIPQKLIDKVMINPICWSLELDSSVNVEFVESVERTESFSSRNKAAKPGAEPLTVTGESVVLTEFSDPKNPSFFSINEIELEYMVMVGLGLGRDLTISYLHPKITEQCKVQSSKYNPTMKNFRKLFMAPFGSGPN